MLAVLCYTTYEPNMTAKILQRERALKGAHWRDTEQNGQEALGFHHAFGALSDSNVGIETNSRLARLA